MIPSPGITHATAPAEMDTLPRLPAGVLESLLTALNQECILALTDLDGRIVFANDAFCRISGFTRAELIGQTHRLIKSGLHSGEFYAGMWRVIKAGGTWHGEVCNRAKNGRLYWVDATISPLSDRGGTVTHYLALRVDITQRKHAQVRMVEQERMANLGHLADRVAHDMNNFLTAATMAMAVDHSHERDNPRLDLVRRALVGLGELTNNLRDLARERPVARQAIEVAELVECAAGMAGYRTRAFDGRVITTDLTALRGIRVSANEGELTSALLNVMVNAVEATAGIDHPAVRIHGRIDGRLARITVENNGPCIPLEIRNRLFQDLTSTKGAGRGRGLASAKRIAVAHGGDLSFDPRALGAAFQFTLPIA